MNETVKPKVVFTIVILIGAFVLLEMGLYVIHQGWNIDFGWNLFQYCLTAINDHSTKLSALEIVLDGIIIYTIIRILWRVGNQVYFTWKSSALFNVRKDVIRTKQLNHQYQNWKTKFIVIQDESFVALAMGVFRPKIIVSTGLLEMFSEQEIEAILLHEWHHCRNYDPLKVFTVTIVKESMGYVPILKGMINYYKVWCELLADRFVIYQMGSAYVLGNVLLKLSRKGMVQSPMIGVSFADVAINYRIQQIIEPHQTLKIPFLRFKPTLMALGIFFIMFPLVLGGCA